MVQEPVYGMKEEESEGESGEGERESENKSEGKGEQNEESADEEEDPDPGHTGVEGMDWLNMVVPAMAPVGWDSGHLY